MASLIGRTLGGYLIEEELGRGAMGVVFKAKQISMDRHVALKFLPKRLAQDEKVVARFQREARAAGQLSHPNLVNVHDVGVVEGLHYISMEYVDGSAVHKRVREKGPYTEKETLDIAGQVASALRAAHAKGILHRDIKPDNFLIDAAGRVRLADLGLARFQHSAKEAEVTSDGTTVGTPHYMSPEQCSGGKVDARSDIYSLGASMYVLATGHTPYDAPTAAAVMVKALTEPPASLKKLNPKLSSGFVVVVEKMMVKDPAKRFQNAQEVIDAIERCRKGLYRSITKDHGKVENIPLTPVAETSRSRLLLYGAAAAVVALVTVALILRARHGGSQPQPAPVAVADPSASDPANAENPSADPSKIQAATEPKVEPKGGPNTEGKVQRVHPSLLKPDVAAMDNAEFAVVKKLRDLKLELAGKLEQDPDAAIARMEEFLKQNPGRRVADIAQEFTTKAKEAKAKLDKDWAAAQEAAETAGPNGSKAAAFHALRRFVEAHGSTKPGATALATMQDLTPALCKEAAQASDSGQFDKAIEMLNTGETSLPETITAPLKKEQGRIVADYKRALAFADADTRNLATILERASTVAKEGDSLTGLRYNFDDCAKVCRDNAPMMKTARAKKDIEALAAMYARAASVMSRMRQAVNASKAVPVPGMGSFKEPGQLTGWEDRGLSFKPKDLPPQTVPWKVVTPEHLQDLAQVLKIAGGDTAAGLLDAGTLAFALGATNVAEEKLKQAAAVNGPDKAVAEAALRILRPPPPPADRESVSKQLFAEAAAARNERDIDKTRKLQQRLIVELADTGFVQTHRKEIHALGLPLPSLPDDKTPAKVPDKTKDVATDKKGEKVEDKKAEKKDEKVADKKDDKKKEDPAVAELKRLGWQEVTGNWTQDQRRKTLFSVTGGGSLTAPILDGGVQCQFQLEESATIGVYMRYVPDTAEIKDLRTTMEEYSLILGRGYGVCQSGTTAAIFGDKTPASASSSAAGRAALEKKTVPMKTNSVPAPAGVHSVVVLARGNHLEVTFDGRSWRTQDKLRADGGAAIVIEGNARLDSPLLAK